MSNIFEDKLKQLEIELSSKQIAQFEKYYELLAEWNKVMNLTTIIEYDDVIEKHFIDSLSIIKAINMDEWREKGCKIMDIGTGAGFPGIPLKIAFPELEIVLLDSLNKKVKFLNAVIEELGLTGIEAIHGRAEDFAQQAKYREQFDICVSRAVANLSTLSEYCIPYLKVGGLFIPYKSAEIDEELEQSIYAIHQLASEMKEVVKFQLPGTDINRSFVIIKKTVKTAKKYPRKAGLPSKEPLSK